MTNAYVKFPLLGACFLNACSVLPVHVNSPQSTRSTLSVPPATAAQSSPVPASMPDKATNKKAITSQAYTLDRIVQTVLKSDPQIAAAFENITQAEADLLTAGLLPNPQVNTDIQLMPLNRAFSVERQGGPPQFDLVVAMPVDWFVFGKRVAAMVSAHKSIDIAAAEYANTVRLRISAAIASYYDVLEAQTMLALVQENKDALSKMEKIILNRVELGGVGTIEADRIQLSIYASLREIRAQELVLASGLNKLRALMGIADGMPITVQGELDIAALQKPLAAEAAFALAEQNRPDLQALQQQIELAKANINLQEAKALPEITPSLGYTRQFQQQAIGFPDANAWLAGVSVSVPLFDRNQGNIAKAKSQRVQSELSFEAQLVDVRAEIEQAVLAFSSACNFLSQDDPGQLEAAQKVRDKITQAYELGGKTLIEVLDAQRAYLETFRVHIGGRSNYWHALNQLNTVMGKKVL